MEGQGNDTFHGGDGGSWTDTIDLQASDGGAPAAGWTMVLDQGSIENSEADYYELTNDSSGTITMDDGTEIAFDGVDKITW